MSIDVISNLCAEGKRIKLFPVTGDSDTALREHSLQMRAHWRTYFHGLR